VVDLSGKNVVLPAIKMTDLNHKSSYSVKVRLIDYGLDWMNEHTDINW